MLKTNKKSICQQSQFALFVLAAIFGFSTSASLNATTNCGTSIVPADSYDRIVGGVRAVPGEFPWMVSLRERSSKLYDHACGAAILNEHWIVTASHCISYDHASRYEVWVGLHKLNTHDKDPNVKKYKISKVIRHEKYFKEICSRHDIALLKTKKPINIEGSKGYINTICLPKDKQDPTGTATVIGWGFLEEDRYINSNTLRKVVVPLVDRETCADAYYDEDIDNNCEIISTQICAGRKGRDSCQNDSGGPLFTTDENGVSTLIGVNSFGMGCGMKNYPGVYTKVAMFQDWMDDIMENN